MGDAEQAPTKSLLKVVLTGGPCSGKTSSLEHMTKTLLAHNVKVLTVPEVPTILLNGGCLFPGAHPTSDAHAKQLFEFEAAVLQLQHATEQSFARIGQSSLVTPSDRVVLILDRGIVDVKAYLPDELWQQLLADLGWNHQTLLDSYDLVLHLITAANGAEVCASLFWLTCAMPRVNLNQSTQTPMTVWTGERERARESELTLIGTWMMCTGVLHSLQQCSTS
jgi:predicted ATPase